MKSQHHLKPALCLAAEKLSNHSQHPRALQATSLHLAAAVLRRREQSKSAAVPPVDSFMDVSAQVLAAVADASRMVQQQLVRHRLGDALVQVRAVFVCCWWSLVFRSFWPVCRTS